MDASMAGKTVEQMAELLVVQSEMTKGCLWVSLKVGWMDSWTAVTRVIERVERRVDPLVDTTVAMMAVQMGVPSAVLTALRTVSSMVGWRDDA